MRLVWLLLLGSACSGSAKWLATHDGDGDGYVALDDCDDSDASVHPGADETCDGVDEDCDGLIDEDPATGGIEAFPDADGDGYGGLDSAWFCAPPRDWADAGTDCDDADPDTHPGAPESCAEDVDRNCDGSVGQEDVDGDGVVACEDCDDTDATRYPGHDEVCDDVDHDCDGSTELGAIDGNTWYADGDGDGYGDPVSPVVSCSPPEGAVDDATDCDDTEPAVHPEADEECNLRDDDCDTLIDEDPVGAPLWYRDLDGDGYGDVSFSVSACSAPEGYVASSEDCDDTDPDVSPAAEERCGGGDEDCDGTVDEPDAVDAATWYLDGDGDGYGTDAATASGCDTPRGYAAEPTDCDDSDSRVNPAALELCSTVGVDDDCDGIVDEADALDVVTWYLDGDGDGYGDVASEACTAPADHVAVGGDCDDGVATVNPGADELCATVGVDDDCDGTADEADAADTIEWYVDDDDDGYGVAAVYGCVQPDGAVGLPGDCDDANTAVNPGAAELCATVGVDDDCDGSVDEDDAADVSTWYLDGDGDGAGDAPAVTCFAPADYVALGGDCDDADPAVSPTADERCSTAGVDDDCDGSVDEADAVDALTWYADADLDGYGAAPATACAAPVGYIATSGDCDDTNYWVNPGVEEHCATAGVDDDCDGFVDEADADDLRTWYEDVDGDLYGGTVTAQACTPPGTGWYATGGDCDDTNFWVNPGTDERCATVGVDDDCDGTVDEADAIDAVTWYLDVDGDLWGDVGTVACAAPSSAYVPNGGDCDEADVLVNPGADEECNGVDDDCDGTTDVGAVDEDTWWYDGDGDGYGDRTVPMSGCSQPAGTVDNDEDCDDLHAAASPVGTEVCDLLDNDCNGTVDDDALVLGDAADCPAESCAELLAVRPSLADAHDNYWVDGDGTGAWLAYCYMRDGGWTNVYAQDFQSSAAGWSHSTTTCGGATIVGGYDYTGYGDTISATVDLMGIPHSQVYVGFTFVFGDSWDGEYASGYVDGTRLWGPHSRDWSSGTNTCGEFWNDEFWTDQWMHAASHTTTTATLSWDTTLDQSADDEWFAVDDVSVWVH